MIRLSSGHEIEFVVASGALAFDGKGWWHEKWILSPLSRLIGIINPDLVFFSPSLFTVFAKTVTFKYLKGNYRWYCPWKCIKLLPGGVVNAVGLSNKGIEWWAEEIGLDVNSKKIALAGSILSDNVIELVEMARIMNDFDLVALEINASCPNTQSDLLENTGKIIESCLSVKKVSRLPLVLKLSVAHNVREIVHNINGAIEVISINSVPWKIIFPNKESPLAHLGGGGVSGQIAQLYTWGLVRDLVAISPIPVIGPSVWGFEDIDRLRKLGAKAISFGSVFTRYPWRPTMFVRKNMKRK